MIELMIVVAIIGILAAIAIPQYQNYTARAQVAEAMTILGGLKTPLVDVAGSQGLASACSTDAAVVANGTTQAKAAGALNESNGYTQSGSYVANVTATPSGTASCKLQANFKATGLNDKVNGKHVAFTYTVANSAWTCSSNLDDGVRPSNCSKET